MTSEVWIGPEVDPARIAPDARIAPGTRISGESTSIGPGCVVGEEGPVVLQDCQLARDVRLKGGYFSGSVFLDGSSMGSGAHLRPGTLLEEQANGAHSVGLKQTILFPFVTLGSLINFCDILMAGGTSRKDHSEVGSSYIHFNYTPNQDKATASLVGDVPRGVLLRERPVFLGGQGGLVGPARIAYGTVIGAGGVCRTDVVEENMLHMPAAPAQRTIPFKPGRYGNVDRIAKNGLIYIGNIRALDVWYRAVRLHFIRDAFDQAVYDGARLNLQRIHTERVKRLEQWAEKAGGAVGIDVKQRLPQLDAAFRGEANPSVPDVLAGEIESADKENYIAAVQGLSGEAVTAAVAWLQGIVEESV